MSHALTNSLPRGLEIKTMGGIGYDGRGFERVFFWGLADMVEIPMDDFVEAVKYVLTNSDLLENDPRPGLIEFIKRLDITDGYNKGGKRLSPQR